MTIKRLRPMNAAAKLLMTSATLIDQMADTLPTFTAIRLRLSGRKVSRASSAQWNPQVQWNGFDRMILMTMTMTSGNRDQYQGM